MKIKLFALALALFLAVGNQTTSATSGLLGKGPQPAPEPPNAQANPTATFRVTLNGFRVNHESDDDILEGDGRGDEVFITSYLWVIAQDTTARSVRGPQTRVMGDVRGRPQRVLAGSGTPNSNRMDGGLRTGDGFPTREPWRRTGSLLTDRPPIVLWQGQLTHGQGGVMILPVIWEWDSADYSVSQASFDRGLPLWFERQRPRITGWVLYPQSGNLQILYRGDEIQLDGKAGTRPIGYEEADNEFGLPVDHIYPQGLVLSYDLANGATQAVNFSAKGVFEIRYKDAHDHGDYSLYLQVEQIPDRYSIESTPRLRP